MFQTVFLTMLFLFSFRVAYVDTGLTTVKLKAEDSCGRQHLIILKLNAKVNLCGRKYFKASLK